MWQLEQIAENNFGMKKTETEETKYSESEVVVDMAKLAKAQRIKMYDLQKEIGKIQKKIQGLSELVEKGEDTETNQAFSNLCNLQNLNCVNLTSFLQAKYPDNFAKYIKVDKYLGEVDEYTGEVGQ